MSFSSMFSRPLLIYDDKCSSCTKFAKAAARLSRGWICIAGHYYSQQAIDTKKMIFPSNYDATKMFWLINKNGAFGARLGLIQVVKEIIIGIFKGFSKNRRYNKEYNNNLEESCDYKKDEENCMSIRNTLSRIFNMIKNSDKINF
ncbi:MAG: hypothetical protein H0X03_06310 [Nitrosopumilus sp.]|nr:hypothetical protein [Nitrosopumilus sp.]